MAIDFNRILIGLRRVAGRSVCNLLCFAALPGDMLNRL